MPFYSKSTCSLEFSRNSELSSDGVLTLWAQRSEQNIWNDHTNSDRTLCFFKYFDANLCTLCYCGHAELLTSDPSSFKILPELLNARVGLLPATPLVFYRHQDPTQPPLSVNLSALFQKLKHGEVIYFHVGLYSFSLIIDLL